MSLIESHIVPGGEFRVYSQKPDIPLTRVKQVHSKTILEWSNKSELDYSSIEADGLVSQDLKAESNLCIVTADCLPVFIAGKKGYAMLHAGWRGLHQEIIKQESISNLEPFFAFIGPHISQKNYQVGEEFNQYFPHSNCLKPDPKSEDKRLFSQYKEAEHQLKKINPNMEIKVSKSCTFDHPELHSYRKDGTTSRNWNVFIYRD